MNPRPSFAPRRARGLSVLLIAALCTVLLAACGGEAQPQAGADGAQAEKATLRIGQQFGIVYLLLDVAQERGLIEQQAKAAGIDVTVQSQQLSGGSAINDALLSGAIDIAGAGTGPLFTIWDRTRGRQDVRGIASLGNFPYQLISNAPRVKSIDDLGQGDRIAVPATGVSVQSRILQYASAQRWGQDQALKLDALQVALPHPDAAAALISGGNEVNTHFSSPPYQQQELVRNPKAHVILDSYQVLGGPSSATVLYATAKFQQDNPKLYHAFVAALDEAAKFIAAHPEEAADIFVKRNPSSDRALVLQVLKDPQVQFKIAPQNTLGLGKFMQQVGAIKQAPAAVSDYFFDDPLIAGGS
ncbi:NitT/TauT family transport system substrate-binding protein [Pseudoxanthomonas sp. GM95]|uniref:ABC transporter substrate-binding protein n=1 Tax=Pseudoxanthomonas sp. GM95 TaxID=1881043 RepID=UPI0008C0D682|nr:ABC transporter substrate-binding protein [Pseudoxanthomonas sp. GM95]SEM18729.1 NitT/TauT family transport system substrate-binding protein [Pseudoxanthomonas sp. GM95]